MGQLIQSNSALIQAAILLPQTATSGAVKASSQGANMDKEQVLRKISDFGSRFGKLEFPPKLVPVPGRFSNCCILIGLNWHSISISLKTNKSETGFI